MLIAPAFNSATSILDLNDRILMMVLSAASVAATWKDIPPHRLSHLFEHQHLGMMRSVERV